MDERVQKNEKAADMSLWEPDEVYTVECEDCGKPKRPDEMEHSETIDICIECTEIRQESWDGFVKQMRRISN